MEVYSNFFDFQVFFLTLKGINMGGKSRENKYFEKEI